MTRIKGMGEAFVSFAAGGWASLGPVSYSLEAGEFVIPADLVASYQIVVSASGCFTGTFNYAPPPVPDKDGWVPRKRYA